MTEAKGKKETKEKEAKTKPSWIKMKPEELEKIVIELAKEGNTPAKIGLILRDKHGIPKVKLLGKNIKDILKENENYVSDQAIIEKRIETIKGHISKNKHDYTATRALTKKLWAVHKMKKEAN